jgi:tripartite-type tricarboxylate transporter receptor subunit TctC
MRNSTARLLLLALMLFGAGATAGAQPYPTRPITIVVPFAAGGPTDVLARVLGERMSRTLGQQIVVENALGGGGSIGTARVARATPDGYTLVMGNLGTHAAAVGLYKNLSYDPRTDFEPIMLMGTTPMVLVTRRDFPAANLKELISFANANPGKVTNGHAGVGSISHLATLNFKNLTKTDLRDVPYRGLSQVVNDVVAGQIDMMFDQVVTATQQIRGGTVKPIAVAAKSRHRAIPDVPSAPEAGLPDFETLAWTALFAPKGTPKPVIDRLVAALNEAFEAPEVAQRMEELGNDVPPPERRTPQALAALVRSEIERWAPLIKASGATAD